MLSNCLVLLLLLLYSCRNKAGHISNLAGPFEVRFDRMEVCPPAQNGLGLFNYTTRIRRDRQDTKKFYYSGVVSHFFHITDDIGVQARISSWNSRGGWIQNAFNHHFQNVCQILKTLDPERLKKYTTIIFGAPQVCPFYAAELTFKDMVVDVNHGVIFNHFFYGKWRLDMQFVLSRAVIGCYRLFMETVPLVGRSSKDPADNFTGTITCRLIKPKFEDLKRYVATHSN